MKKPIARKRVKMWARVCINKNKPCGLVEVTWEKIKPQASDEVCTPCEVSYSLPPKSRKR